MVRSLLLIVATWALPAVALSATCSADADPTGHFASSPQINEYAFKFNVESNDCTRYSCRGFIRYTVTYRDSVNTYRSGTQNGMLEYTIPSGRSRATAQDKIQIGIAGDRTVRIQDVSIEEVSCRAP